MPKPTQVVFSDENLTRIDRCARDAVRQIVDYHMRQRVLKLDWGGRAFLSDNHQEISTIRLVVVKFTKKRGWEIRSLSPLFDETNPHYNGFANAVREAIEEHLKVKYHIQEKDPEQKGNK